MYKIQNKKTLISVSLLVVVAVSVFFMSISPGNEMSPELLDNEYFSVEFPTDWKLVDSSRSEAVLTWHVVSNDVEWGTGQPAQLDIEGLQEGFWFRVMISPVTANEPASISDRIAGIEADEEARSHFYERYTTKEDVETLITESYPHGHYYNAVAFKDSLKYNFQLNYPRPFPEHEELAMFKAILDTAELR